MASKPLLKGVMHCAEFPSWFLLIWYIESLEFSYTIIIVGNKTTRNDLHIFSVNIMANTIWIQEKEKIDKIREYGRAHTKREKIPHWKGMTLKTLNWMY